MPNPLRPPRSSLILAALCLLCLYSFQRGPGGQLEMFGAPYYVIDYGSGFIKRGLIGQLYLTVSDRNHAALIWQAAKFIHRACAGAIIAALLVWTWHLATRTRENAPWRLLAITLIFAAGQFLPTLSATAGYLDVYVYVALLAAFIAVARGNLLLAAGIGAIGPLIHEMFVFLWLPLAFMLAVTPGQMGRRALAAASAILSTILVVLLHDPRAIAAQMALAPLDPALRTAMLQSQFGQSVSGSMAHMAGLYARHTLRCLVELVFFEAPTALMLTLATRGMPRRTALALLAAAIAPLALLLFAWDLSRLMLAGQFSLMLCILLERTYAHDHSRKLTTPERACAAAALALLIPLPFIYGYPERIIVGPVLFGLIPGFDAWLHQFV